MLALDGPTHRARAAQLLWPDVNEKQARSNLRQRLFRLRQTAQRDVVDSTSLLRLLDDVTLDLAQIHRQIAADPDAAQGELLGNQDYSDNEMLEEWAQQARARWRTTRLNLLAEVASDLEAKQQIAAALPYAGRMVADDPLLEHAHRRLMRLHYLRGDRAAALAAFERCRTALRRGIDAAPARETLQLATLIESGGALAQAAPAPRPLGALRPPRLVGRQAEWQELEQGLGAGRALLVEGEPGIGKTRLINDFARAQGSVPVFGARPGDAQLPFALLARVVQELVARHGKPADEWVCLELARIAPEMGNAAHGKLEPLRMQQAALKALDQWRAAGLPMLVIDDLHFADAATLELLPAMSCLPGLPCLFGVRANERPAAVTVWLDSQGDAAPARTVLGPLDLDAVRALLESLAIDGLSADQWAAPLARHTGGNPLFILETLISMLNRGGHAMPPWPAALPAPQHVGELIERRLAQLSAPALKLARLAAIAGQDFDVELAAKVLGQHALDIGDPWRELEAAQVIRDEAFAHDLIFEATLRSVPAAIASAMHREVAVQLQARGRPAARVAAHWENAAEWAAAGAAYDAAAQAAVRRADEAALWERAAACHEHSLDRASAFKARCASVTAVMASRPVEEARTLTERLLADAQGDLERLDALLERTTLLLVQGDSAAALTSGGESLDLACRTGQPWREFDAARAMATALAQSSRAPEGAALLRQYATRVEVDGTAQHRFTYWSDLGYVLKEAGSMSDAFQAMQKAAELASVIGDRHEVVTCTANAGHFLLMLGRTEEAYESGLRAKRLRRDFAHDEDIVACMVDMNVATFGLLMGHYEQSLVLYESALLRMRASQAPAWAAACESNFALAWLYLGQTARAMQVLQPLQIEVGPPTLARRLIVEGRIERTLGRSALPKLREALALLGDGGDAFQHGVVQLDEARELDPPLAVTACQRCRADAEQREFFGLAMRSRFVEIDALLRAGDVPAAAGLAREARDLLTQCHPIDMYWPEALWLLARAFDANGNEADALSALREAAHWIRNAALAEVPEPFRDTFLQRQPVNVAVLALADRRLRP